MTIYRVRTERSHVYPERHRVLRVTVRADGRTIVLLDGGEIQRWHALSPCLQYHGVAWWDLHDAAGRVRELPAALRN